jgi:hypothetical protein
LIGGGRGLRHEQSEQENADNLAPEVPERRTTGAYAQGFPTGWPGLGVVFHAVMDFGGKRGGLDGEISG